MKSIIYITILLFSINMLAQRPNMRRSNQNFNPEQYAETQSKKLALALDLDQKQIKEVKALQLQRAKERNANRELRDARRGKGERPSQEELFAIRDKQLDAQLEHQNKMKNILSKEQYISWKELQKNRRQERPLNRNTPQKRKNNFKR